MAAWSKNAFEDAGRQRKAAFLVFAIDDYFEPLGKLDAVVIATVESWADQDWEGIAGLAGVRRPSLATRELVLRLLRARAERRSQ